MVVIPTERAMRKLNNITNKRFLTYVRNDNQM